MEINFKKEFTSDLLEHFFKSMIAMKENNKNITLSDYRYFAYGVHQTLKGTKPQSEIYKILKEIKKFAHHLTNCEDCHN